MRISKSKIFPDLLIEVKIHLKEFTGSTDNDSEITAIYQTALDQISNDVEFDIIPTVTTIEDYRFCGQIYKIDQANIVLSGITGTTSTGQQTVIPASACTLYFHQQFTNVKLPESFSFEVIQVRYRSGLSILPAPLNHAVKIYSSILYDSFGDNEKEFTTYQRLISFYKNIMQ